MPGPQYRCRKQVTTWSYQSQIQGSPVSQEGSDRGHTARFISQATKNATGENIGPHFFPDISTEKLCSLSISNL